MAANPGTVSKKDSLGGVVNNIDGMLNLLERDKREVVMMLEQSQVEADKLSQKNVTITSHLQQIQSQFEVLPKEDIRTAYDAAMDVQQRLVVMRGQIEKLQSDRNHLDKEIADLKELKNSYMSTTDVGSGKLGKGFASVEMLIQAQEAERLSLSRQIHDGPAQQLSNFILQTEIALRLFDIDQEKARNELNSLKGAASNTFQQVRDFIFELRPMMLDDLGLIPTIRRYIDAYKEKTGIDIGINTTGKERRLENYLEVLIFRSFQEILKNATTHSQATQIKVIVNMSEKDIRITVEDNGKGFDPSAILKNEKHSSLKLIQERMNMLEGNLDVDSKIGNGSKISFSLVTE